MTIEQLKKIKVGEIVAWRFMDPATNDDIVGIVISVQRRRSDTPFARVQCFDGSETGIGKLGMRDWMILTK